MDLFKPLYKSHRRELPNNAFDASNIDKWSGPYTLRKELHLSPPSLHDAYSAYNLTAPVEIEEWTVNEVPGLRILPGLVTPELQAALVMEATSEYLEPEDHLTNLDAHGVTERPLDVFHYTSTNVKPRLRWVTLGGQYNWTTKQYPTFEVGKTGCPSFPQKLGQFMKSAFNVEAQAAIVNYYSPGDTLSPHQDVAERCDQDLISISLGCSCVFYAGLKRYDQEPLAITLRSGDVVVMGGESRHAFHGVGRVWAPAPHSLRELLDERLQSWIETKRVNINVRQMV